MAMKKTGLRRIIDNRREKTVTLIKVLRILMPFAKVSATPVVSTV